MSTVKVGFWILTALVAIPNALAGGMYLATGSEGPLVALLGYPLHFAMLLGTWKLLGAVALLAPVRHPAVSWAYAGFFFTLSGAAVAHLSIADPGGAVPPLVMLAMLGGSGWLRPQALGGAQAEDALRTPATA
jgi:hypothetical protein